MAEWWSGTDVNFYIDQDDLKKYYGKEHGYLIMNHRYEVDWLMGFILCDRVHILGVSNLISIFIFIYSFIFFFQSEVYIII